MLREVFAHLTEHSFPSCPLPPPPSFLHPSICRSALPLPPPPPSPPLLPGPWGAINTWTPAASSSGPTFYFRKRFSLSNTACITGLLLDVLVKDGMQLFINNAEALRVNMPNSTLYVNTRVRESVGEGRVGGVVHPVNFVIGGLCS